MTMTAENPILSLRTLNDIELRISSNTETIKDYETLDFFLSSIGLAGYLMGVLTRNGYSNYQQYLSDKKNPSRPNLMAINSIYGNVNGLLIGLKNYAQSKNLIV